MFTLEFIFKYHRFVLPYAVDSTKAYIRYIMVTLLTTVVFKVKNYAAIQTTAYTDNSMVTLCPKVFFVYLQDASIYPA